MVPEWDARGRCLHIVPNRLHTRRVSSSCRSAHRGEPPRRPQGAKAEERAWDRGHLGHFFR